MITRRNKNTKLNSNTTTKEVFVDELERVRLEKIKNGELEKVKVEDSKLGDFETVVNKKKSKNEK